MISKTRVKNFNRIDLSKDLLISEHKARTSESVLFNHYEKLKAWREVQKEDQFLDLNIDKRRAKKEKSEIELLNLENETRKKLGLTTFDSYQEFLDRNEDPKETDVEEEILLEAANVLSDFILQSYKPVISLNRAS